MLILNLVIHNDVVIVKGKKWCKRALKDLYSKRVIVWPMTFFEHVYSVNPRAKSMYTLYTLYRIIGDFGAI